MPTGAQLPLIRLPGFEWPTNATLNFAPLERALTQRLEQQRWLTQQQREEDRLGLERDRFGLEGQRFGLETRRFEADQTERAAVANRWRQQFGLSQAREEREERTRQHTIFSNLAETVRGITDPDQRRGAWERMVMGDRRIADLLGRHGVDPTDFERGPDLLIGLTRDPLERREREARIESLMERSRARTQDAETRRLRLLYDQFQDRLGDNPTEEAWNAENQPGGIIHSIFGGPRSFAERDTLLRQVQDRRRQLRIPGEDELLALGIPAGEARTVQRRAALRQLLGPAGPGYTWDIVNGRIERVREGGDRDPRNPISTEQIEFNMEQLRDVFAILAGTRRPDGTLDTRGAAGPAGRGISRIPMIGGWLNPGTAEAFLGAEHAALNLSYALSGRQIGQAEQGRILNLFVPNASDSPEISAFKLNAAMSLFQRLLEARGRGAGDRERAQMFDSELVRQARALRRARELEESRRSGRQPPPERRPEQTPPPPGEVPPAGPGQLRDLSDEELLRRLGRPAPGGGG